MSKQKQNKPNTLNRKVFIYEIYCKKRGIDEEQSFNYISQLFTELDCIKGTLEYNNTIDNKWYGIESVYNNGNYIKCVLICCKYNYTPNLIDVKNRAERISPKTNTEGDKEKTHILIKNNVIAYEQRRNGMGAYVLQKLLNKAWNNIRNNYDNTITSIVLKQVIDNNFLETIQKANKINNAKFVVKSSHFGSEFLNFSNDSGVEDLYTLEVKSKRKKSIDKISLIDKIERYLTDEQITKVTVNIYDEDGNPRIINTDEFSKQYNIYVEKNKNGEVIDDDIFEKLDELI